MHPFADKRLTGFCVYCGGPPETRDHVPSKVFLDEPVRVMLPVVGACSACNQSFSMDEEYLACFLGAVLAGSARPADQERPKVRKALEHKPNLARLIATSSHTESTGTKNWNPDLTRVENVLVKLARGHVAYELSQPMLGSPESVNAVPGILMSADERTSFNRPRSQEAVEAWPELGSRAFLRAVGEPPFHDQPGPWIEIQPGRYRYLVEEGPEGEIEVRIVISEYLFCQLRWRH